PAAGNTADLALGGIVRKTYPPIAEEVGEALPVVEQVMHGLGHRIVTREDIALLAHPPLKFLDDRRDLFLPHREAFSSRLAVDLPLDVEDPVDTLQGFQRQRRDDRPCVPLALELLGDIDQFEELPAAVRP